MAAWFFGMRFRAAVLYGAHQIFTRLAADRIVAPGRFRGRNYRRIVGSLIIYLQFLWFVGRWSQKFSAAGPIIPCSPAYA